MYFNYNNTLKDVLREYIDEYGNLEEALINIPKLKDISSIDVNIINFIHDDLGHFNRDPEIKKLIEDIVTVLFSNNIKNNFINNDKSFSEFIFNLKYIILILLNQFNKAFEFDRSNLIFTIDYILYIIKLYPHKNIRQFCESKMLNPDILINNKYSSTYIEIYDTECTASQSLKKTIINETIELKKYLKYKNKFIKLKNYFINKDN
jgi:hypothetical protein